MPILDADRLDGDPLHADVVVVGSGPAGLTLAMDLARAGVDVLVLESGGDQPSSEKGALDEGESVGVPLTFNGDELTPAQIRLRALGGTSGHWTGLCAPLDPIDFELRPWLGGPGWPITYDDLQPWYRRAEATLGLEVDGWDPTRWHERFATRPLLLDQERLVEKTFMYSPPTRFGTDFAGELRAADGPRVVLNATLVSIVTTGSNVDSLVVVRSDGRAFPVAAAHATVLATGGLEVPRILLASGDVANSSGHVGRGFHEHVHRWAGQVHLQPSLDELEFHVVKDYSDGFVVGAPPPSGFWAGWALSPALQREELLHNTAVFLWLGFHPPWVPVIPGMAQPVADLVAAVHGRAPSVTGLINVRGEQRFDAESQVRLGAETDRYGVPRLVVDWRVGDDDERSLRRAVEVLGEELGRAGVGRVEIDPGGEPLRRRPVEIGNHPMGTARMSLDAGDGVVDPDLRCHDLDDLYVVGSAVFPTAGHPNPTLTIVALAHRLAAHLVARIAGAAQSS